jgi:putative transposase
MQNRFTTAVTFPVVFISSAIRGYARFQLSPRYIEELLFERGVIVSYETVRRWCDKYGACLAHRLKATRPKPGTPWHLDEVFVTLRGERYLLWRAVDEHGVELDILLQKRRDKAGSGQTFLQACAAPESGASQDCHRSCAAIQRRKPTSRSWST